MKPRGIIIPPFTDYKTSPDGKLIESELNIGFIKKCVLYWDFIRTTDSGGSIWYDYETRTYQLTYSPTADNAKYGFKDDQLFNPDKTLRINEIPELKLLAEEGILSVTRGKLLVEKDNIKTFKRMTEDPDEFISISQLSVFKKLENDTIQWSLCGNRQPVIPSDIDTTKYYFLDLEELRESRGHVPYGEMVTFYSVPLSDIQLKLINPQIIAKFGPSINIQLNNILPIPDEDTPIEKILEFKRKRRDELQRFRIALDQLYLDTLSAVEKSKDPARELEHGVNIFERELIDLKKAAGSGSFRKVASKTQIKINPLQFGTTLAGGIIAGGFLYGQPLNIPVLGATSALFAGALAGSISIQFNAKDAKPILESDSRMDFAYVLEAEKKFSKAKRHKRH